jgi:hypothetical protein
MKMNVKKNDQSSVWELARGIANFILSVMLLLSLAVGEIHFIPIGALGLVLANFDLLKGIIDDEKPRAKASY